MRSRTLSRRELIAAGPRDSGVYAQFVGPRGQALSSTTRAATSCARCTADAGLIAATGEASLGQPTWFVTGTDVAGVMAAARAFTAAKLHDHFAVAVSGTTVIPVPVSPGS